MLTLTTLRRRVVLVHMLLALFAALGGVRAAGAEEMWSLAGSFNGWNTRDPHWVMIPSLDAPDLWQLDQRLGPGTYEFKFVRNGEWGQGHFGAAPGDGFQLEQPGANIPLRIGAEAVYRIYLDTRRKTWRVRIAEIDEPVVVVKILGQPRVEHPFRVWAGASLFEGSPNDVTVSFAALGQPTRQKALDDRFALDITPTQAGPLRVEVTLHDGDRSATAGIDLDVRPAAHVRWSTTHDPRNPGGMELEPQWDGSERAILRTGRETEFSSVVVFTGEGPAREFGGFVAPAGVYALEVRNGRVETRSGADGALGGVLQPGAWRRFVYRPRRPLESVHLVGDFNYWAGPQSGSGRAIEMLPRADGSYSAIVRLPEGPQRYAFLIDGQRRIPDPGAGHSATDPTGAPASLIVVGPRPEDFPKPRPDEIERSGVRHAPSSAADFTPISRALGIADIAIRALPEDVEVAEALVMTSEGSTRRVPMTRSRDGAGFDRFSARVMSGSPELRYAFTLRDGAASVTTDVFTVSIEPDPETPDWAKGAVWYQIFPERFRNGNPLNDPGGPWVTLKRWTSDWYAVEPEEERAWRIRAGSGPNDPLPPRKGGPLFHMIFDRRYGGDLQGVVEKLDYLKDIGVTAIYLNPIFEAESLHKYDATDYRHIDDNFATPASAGRTPEEWRFLEGETADPATWTWTAADRYFIDEFLPACRARGLRVVLDGVFNHTGRAFWAFRDIEQRGAASPYKDWYFCTFDENGKLVSWESWFNTGSLPKFRQTPEGDLVPPVKKHIFDITRRWMDPNGDGDPSDGIDGWRLDVALDVGQPFWRDWRKLVKSINPEAIIIAEIWEDADPYLTGDSFDTQMHYPFAVPVLDWLGVRPGMTEFDLRRALDAAFANAPQTNLIHQNLFGSHDTDRYVSMLLNPGRGYDQGNRPQDHDFPYVDERPGDDVYALSLLGVAIQATYLGAPMVYYGDEVGMWGADDPTDRKPFPWPDTPMEVEAERADHQLRAEYRRWFTLRSDPRIGPVLRLGALRHLDSGDLNVFAFERSLNGLRVVVVVNRQNQSFDARRLLPASVSDAMVGPMQARWWTIE